MTPSTVVRYAFAAGLVLTATFALAGCGPSAHDTSGSDREVAVTCPTSGVLTVIGVDGTGTFQSEQTKASVLRTLDDHVRRTAICGGHLRAFFFASSTGATVPLYDGDLQVDAPTENAQLRKANKLAAQVSTTIAEQYDSALAGLTGVGTDVLGMLSLLAQANAQFPELAPTNVLLTDGEDNIGIDISQLTSTEIATAFADQHPVPDLSGADVSIIGVGKQGAGELPSSVIAHLTTFWERICHNTGAAPCHVSTEGR